MVDVTKMTDEQRAIMLLGQRVEALEIALLNMSQALAEKEHGVELVREAAKAASSDLPRFAADPHPYDSLVDWYRLRRSQPVEGSFVSDFPSHHRASA